MIGLFVLVLLIVAGLLFYRRRRKRHTVRATATTGPEQSKDKPELHGDSMVPPRFEMDGGGRNGRPGSAMSELPVREPIGSELREEG